MSNLVFLKDNEIERILTYEKKFNKNSIETCYDVVPNNPEVQLWQKTFFELVRQNGDIDLINKIEAVLKIGISITNNSFKSKEICDVAMSYSTNSIIVLSNKNPLYLKIIEYFNFKKKIVILYTNNLEDFKLTYTNLIVKYSFSPNKKVFEESTNYLVDIINIHQVPNNSKVVLV